MAGNDRVTVDLQDGIKIIEGRIGALETVVLGLDRNLKAVMDRVARTENPPVEACQPMTKRQFIETYALARARARPASLSGEAAVLSAVHAWMEIERSCK